MDMMKSFKKLCTPAALYFVLSMIALVMMVVQNYHNTHTLCLGKYSCSVPSVMMVLVLNLVYILFWTWILQLICKSGWSIISWVLVLFPFVVIFLFVILGMTQV